MNHLLIFEEYLGNTFESFEKKMNKKCVKRYHSNSESYSVFIDDNEFMFDDNEVHSIEVNNFNFNSLEDTLKMLETSNLKWEVFQKYSYDKYLVIKFNNYIYLEYSFDSEFFLLNTIRISDKE